MFCSIFSHTYIYTYIYIYIYIYTYNYIYIHMYYIPHHTTIIYVKQRIEAYHSRHFGLCKGFRQHRNQGNTWKSESAEDSSKLAVKDEDATLGSEVAHCGGGCGFAGEFAKQKSRKIEMGTSEISRIKIWDPYRFKLRTCRFDDLTTSIRSSAARRIFNQYQLALASGHGDSFMW